MKIVIFRGGLGNQIFDYLFCMYMKKHLVNERVFGAYWTWSLTEHHGLEIQKVFRVTLPPSNFLTDFISKVAYKLTKKYHIHNNTEFSKLKNRVALNGSWVNDTYYKDENVKEILQFRTENLTEECVKTAEVIKTSNTPIAVHIRRGDYLHPWNYEKFGKFCTKEYYVRAIEEIRKRFPDSHLFFFSDDLEWVRENLMWENSTLVDCNTGDNSWQDLYLMSCCSHHIIANSTFSYWGAMLGGRDDNHVVIAPKKWYMWEEPYIFPKDWLRM